jgi:hypothetical protein
MGESLPTSVLTAQYALDKGSNVPLLFYGYLSTALTIAGFM